MFTAWQSKIGEGDFARNSRVWKQSKFSQAAWSSYLYLFDATSLSVWTPPASIVSEDASDAYEIVDAGGALWKWLRKKTANTLTKRCFFNTYETFLVPVKARFFFYFTTIASFQFAFWTCLVASSNTWWRVVWLLRDAWTWHAKHNWRRANTNAEFLTSDSWCLDLVGGGYDYKIAVSTGVQYIAEVRRDATTWKQRIRVSADNGATRFNTCEQPNALWQSRVWFVDWTWQTPNIHLKRVEVEALT